MNQRPDHLETELPSLTLRSHDRADLAGLVVDLVGRRAVVVNRNGCHYEYRIWQGLRRSALADVVDVVTEEEWWSHRLLGLAPLRVVRWPAQAVWVEM
jgi:hypothetical protein